EDNGQGIVEEHFERIFEMFYRATRKNSGSGIGLYIVKEAIDKMDAVIEVKSKLNQGTQFKIVIPNK
ncbi:MAG: HAMP domain-containing histidine kinase, partial [Bacteroidetes bacterium]|nr:HAMP domain-containing histidine kinase [Bacteroidota bacterium]